MTSYDDRIDNVQATTKASIEHQQHSHQMTKKQGKHDNSIDGYAASKH